MITLNYLQENKASEKDLELVQKVIKNISKKNLLEILDHITYIKFGILLVTALYQENICSEEEIENKLLPKLNAVINNRYSTKRFLPGTLVEFKGKKAIVYGDKAFLGEAIDTYSEVKIGVLKDNKILGDIVVDCSDILVIDEHNLAKNLTLLLDYRP